MEQANHAYGTESLRGDIMKKISFTLLFIIMVAGSVNAQIIWPLNNLPDYDIANDISSPFGPRVIKNQYSQYQYDFHGAIDIVESSDNSVHSVDDYGEVVKKAHYSTPSGTFTVVVVQYPDSNNPQNAPYYVRYTGLTFSSYFQIQHEVFNKGDYIGDYDLGYAHLDFKYYPDVKNTGQNIYTNPDNRVNPLDLLPYNNDAGNLYVTLKSIQWNQILNQPSKDYLSIKLEDHGLDFNDLSVFISAKANNGQSLNQTDILYGVNQPYYEVNYIKRTNCANDGPVLSNPYGLNTSLENSYGGTIGGGVLIIPDSYNHWGTDGKIVEYRFLLNPQYSRDIQNNQMLVQVEATDIKGRQKTFPWESAIPTPIGGGGTPGVPTNVVASSNSINMSVNLSWQPADNAEFYSVYRRKTSESDSTYQSIGISQDPSFEDTYKTIPGTSYTYAVTAYNGSEESPRSTDVTATMPGSGTIFTDRIWAGANITGNVTVNNNAKLTIQQDSRITLGSGVTVSDSAAMNISRGTQIFLGSGINIVDGSGSKITANGTSGDPVEFRRLDPNSSWNIIYLRGNGNQFTWTLFDGGYEDVAVESAGNDFSNCTFRNGWRGISSYWDQAGDGGRSSFYLTNCMVEDNSSVGVVAYHTDAFLSTSTIRHNASAGLWLYDSYPGISGNAIINNDTANNAGRAGLEVVGGSDVVLTPYEGNFLSSGGNQFADNPVYQILVDASSFLSMGNDHNSGYNSVTRGTGNSNYLLYNESSTSVAARGNWWDTSNPDASLFYGPVDYSSGL